MVQLRHHGIHGIRTLSTTLLFLSGLFFDGRSSVIRGAPTNGTWQGSGGNSGNSGNSGSGGIGGGGSGGGSNVELIRKYQSEEKREKKRNY